MARRTRNSRTQPQIPAGQNTLASPNERLEISTLETWLWDAACAIRGATDAPKFKDFILPLVLQDNYRVDENTLTSFGSAV